MVYEAVFWYCQDWCGQINGYHNNISYEWCEIMVENKNKGSLEYWMTYDQYLGMFEARVEITVPTK